MLPEAARDSDGRAEAIPRHAGEALRAWRSGTEMLPAHPVCGVMPISAVVGPPRTHSAIDAESALGGPYQATSTASGAGSDARKPSTTLINAGSASAWMLTGASR